MMQLRDAGFKPDLIVAHPGWGESLFCKDVWPGSRLLVFAEFFYEAEGADYGFDPEFQRDDTSARAALRLKNTMLLHALYACDAAYAPTQWQHSRLPPEYRAKANVVFDGIDTRVVKPDDTATFTIPGSALVLRAGDEVMTFVNRNLEPYRGFHTFMRSLPAVFARRPDARCVVVGGDGVSYGQKCADAASWREAMLRELDGRLPLDRIHFVGRLAYMDYLRLLQVSRCHVYLTYPFVLGWSCVEALAAGCMVVGSDTAPVREVIEHGRNGLLTDFFDSAALAEKACEVLENPERFTAQRVAARDTAVARYDLHSRCLPLQLSLVRSLLD